MHSSRMRTVRTVRSSDSTSGGVSALGGVCSRRCLLWGVSAPGVAAPRGSALGGMSAPRGCLLPGDVVSQHALRQRPLSPRGQTDACKDITFATSLRTVIIIFMKTLLTTYKLKDGLYDNNKNILFTFMGNI